MKNALKSSLALVLLIGIANTADAALMLDFGATTVTPAAANISPAHSVSVVPSIELTWNQVQVADIASGLLYSDGSAATGVSLNLGMETAAGSGILNFSTNPGGLLTGSGSGIYASPNVARDGIFGNANFANGFRLDGLTAGNYTLYFMGRNTNNTLTTQSARFYAATGSSSTTFTFAPELNFADVANSTSTSTSSFGLGTNYGTLNVSISTGQSLFFAADGTGADLRGFINAVQIVAVPEPGTYALFGTGLAALLVLRRSRHRTDSRTQISSRT